MWLDPAPAEGLAPSYGVTDTLEGKAQDAAVLCSVRALERSFGLPLWGALAPHGRPPPLGTISPDQRLELCFRKKRTPAAEDYQTIARRP